MKIVWTTVRQHLIDDWHQAWKWISVWMAAALIGLDVIAANFDEVSSHLPKHWVGYLSAMILIGRLIKQGKAIQAAAPKEEKPAP
jgi:hypothetical protein